VTHDPSEYSIVSVDFIDPSVPSESHMIAASPNIAKYLTEQMRDTGWLTLRNQEDVRCINAAIVKGVSFRAVVKK